MIERTARLLAVAATLAIVVGWPGRAHAQEATAEDGAEASSLVDDTTEDASEGVEPVSTAEDADETVCVGVDPESPTCPRCDGGGSCYEPRYVVGDDVHHGAYGSFSFRVADVLADAAVLLGARAAWLIDHRFAIGGAGYGVVTDVAAPRSSLPTSSDPSLSMTYGGVLFEYHFIPEKRFHPSLSLLVGGAGISIEGPASAANGAAGAASATGGLSSLLGGGNAVVDDGAFVAEIEFHVHAHVVRYVQLGLGVSYRFVADVDLPGIDDIDLWGVTGEFLVTLGEF